MKRGPYTISADSVRLWGHFEIRNRAEANDLINALRELAATLPAKPARQKESDGGPGGGE